MANVEEMSGKVAVVTGASKVLDDPGPPSPSTWPTKVRR